MHYFYGKVNQGVSCCPLYGGSPYLGKSVMRGFTVLRDRIRGHHSSS